MSTVNRKPYDLRQIDVHNPSELRLHSQRMNRPPDVIAYAVAKVGPDADAVAAYLGV